MHSRGREEKRERRGRAGVPLIGVLLATEFSGEKERERSQGNEKREA